jgi:antitoxin component HigA of HigAB toxin-antitoxin module
MSTTLADPVEMIRRGAPRLIRSREEFAEYTRALLSLTAKPKPTAAEQDAINLLTLLIGQYETALRPAPKGTAVEVLRQLMRRNGLSQSALTPEFGCSTVASQVLRGDRQFTRSHIARLGKRFNVSPAAFFDESSGVPLTRDMGENAKAKQANPSTKRAVRAVAKKGGAR